MQLPWVPNAATLTASPGNAGASNNNSYAESPKCQGNADQELCMNKRKGTPIDTQWG